MPVNRCSQLLCGSVRFSPIKATTCGVRSTEKQLAGWNSTKTNCRLTMSVCSLRNQSPNDPRNQRLRHLRLNRVQIPSLMQRLPEEGSGRRQTIHRFFAHAESTSLLQMIAPSQPPQNSECLHRSPSNRRTPGLSMFPVPIAEQNIGSPCSLWGDELNVANVTRSLI